MYASVDRALLAFGNKFYLKLLDQFIFVVPTIVNSSSLSKCPRKLAKEQYVTRERTLQFD